MDKAFDKAKDIQPRSAPTRVEKPITETVVELAPEPSKEPEEVPVKRQKLSASLQDENNIPSGLKLPPRRLPLSIQSQTPFVQPAGRGRPIGANEAVEIPVKTFNNRAEGHGTRSKTRQSHVDLIDDDLDSAVDCVPPSPTKLSETLVYPPEGRKKAEVDSSDIERLRDGEFLNDNLIGFYLRFLEHHLELNKPEVAKRVYFFNSYFFDTLTSQAKGKKGINYGGVEKWTRNVDLFSQDYVIVPINESAHWYLAIICNLGSLTKSKQDDTKPEAEPEPTSQSVPLRPRQVEEIPETPPRRVSTPEQSARESFASMKISDSLPNTQSEEDWPEKEENQVSHPAEFRNGGTPSITELSQKDGGKGKKPKRKGAILSSDQPTIITFDSLGAARQPAVKILKTYLLEEAGSKRSLTVDIKDIKGMTAREIPLQPNFSDCGLYLLAYMEKFVQDPDTFVRSLLQKQMNADDWPALKSGLLRRRLRSFFFKLQEEQKNNTEQRKLVDAQPISYLLGPSHAGVVDENEGHANVASAESEAVEETVSEATGDVQDQASAAELGEPEVVQETQLSQFQKPDAIADAQAAPEKAEPEPAQPAEEAQDDEDVVEVVQEPQTMRPNVSKGLEKTSPKVRTSPKFLHKEDTEHPLSKTIPIPENSEVKKEDSDNVLEIFDFVNSEPRVELEVQVPPRIQVPGTPPSAVKGRKAAQSPRQPKSRKREI